MTQRTVAVDWAGLRPRAEPPAGEGLRERKKRMLRQQLSDTATEMFLERGFDAVRVAEIAEACDVSEKTVFNYFPTKESLVLDLGDAVEAALRTTLADPGLMPVEAVLKILSEQLAAVTSWLAAQHDRVLAAEQFRRFGMLIRSTPSLRAYQRDTTERLITVAAEVLAQRTGLSPRDPEPRIAANALLGLWPIQFQELDRYLDDTRTPEQLHKAVTTQVERAAQLIQTGLSHFAAETADPRSPSPPRPGPASSYSPAPEPKTPPAHSPSASSPGTASTQTPNPPANCSAPPPPPPRPGPASSYSPDPEPKTPPAHSPSAS